MPTPRRQLTPEVIQATRQWFAENALACLREAEAGVFKVNDLPRYIADCRQRHDDALAGKFDRSLAFLQRAHYLQTGKCPALLP